MNNDKYDYVAEKKETKSECVMCGKKITEEEFEYEDYFVLFRGFTPIAFQGCVCFDCWENRKAKQGVVSWKRKV